MHKGRAYRNHLRADRDAGLPEDDRDRLRAAVPTLRAAGERKSTRPCSHPCHVQTCSRAHYSNYRFAVSSASFPSPLLYALSSPLPPCLPHAGVSLCLCLSLSLSLSLVCVCTCLSLSGVCVYMSLSLCLRVSVCSVCVRLPQLEVRASRVHPAVYPALPRAATPRVSSRLQ